jgi:hypothetical protein
MQNAFRSRKETREAEAAKVGNSLQEKKEPEPDNLNGADGSDEQLPGSVEEAERRALDPFSAGADADSAELKAEKADADIDPDVPRAAG